MDRPSKADGLTCARVFRTRDYLRRNSRFSDEQIVAILREADANPVGTVAKKRSVSKQAIYTWRKRFGAMQSDDVRRLNWRTRV